ncbi:helix-turn-helix transcriptional regulator [Amphibacillus sp. Q70]|uniref:helix-turn-helix transcriptional regulator n=1 Tax=Amphibacillus sp. Q70 TaxID=3453416 RepID=UPI003F87E2F8
MIVTIVSDKMAAQQLAANIKYYRKQYNWTQQQLANELKISRSVIAKWENGDVLPDLPALIKLSQVFHQTIDHLLGMNEHADQLLSDFQQFYQANIEEELTIDESFLDLVNYLVKNPILKEQLEQVTQLSIKQQKAIQRMFGTLVNEIEKL